MVLNACAQEERIADKVQETFRALTVFELDSATLWDKIGMRVDQYLEDVKARNSKTSKNE